MSEPSKAPLTAPEEKHSFNWRAFVLWPCVVLILYVLSAGPMVRLWEKGSVSDDLMSALYSPVNWAYSRTFLHKPIGLYLHLWCKRFNANGDLD